MKLVNFLSQSFIIFLLLLSIPKQLISQQNSTCPPNIDFELGNLNNWKPFTGSCCPINTGSAGASTGRHTIMSGTGTDPYGGFPVVPSGGGSYALKIGNNSTGAQAEKVRYFVRVPNNVNNYSFIYRYAVVFQDPGHTAAQQPRFEVKTFDSATNQSLNCNTHTYIAASNIPGFTRSNINSSVYYRAWSTATINLSGYAGRTIILDFASGDCSLNGHFGYGYVDLSCGLFQINTVACKKQKTSTLTAPPGFQSYKWLDSSKTQVLGTSSTLIVNTPSSLKKYYVVLTPFQGFGCPDTLSTQITVTNVKADFSIEPSKNLCFKGNNYTFKNNSSTNSTPMSYIWSFGDGQSSTLTSPSKSYNTADSFNIRLITSSAEGCKDTLTKGLRIYPSPVPEFNINDSLQCIRSHSFKFTNTTTLSSGSMNYNWTFGDDSSSTSNNPTKAYNSFGNYTVKLKVTSDQNCTDSTSKNVSVFEMPVARFSVNDSDQCVKNNLFSFLNNSSISSGTNSYAWNFGDNSTSNITSPNKAYDSAKNFLVRLIASSNKNCKDSAFKPVVNYAQPFAKFNINDSAQCFRSHLFSFTNNSIIGKGAMNYNWTFGDDSSSTSNNPTKAYNSFGNYTVKLKVTSDQNCTDSTSKNVSVFEMPVARFSVNDSDQCVKNNLFSFLNNSSISSGTNSYAWNFGDNSTSNITSPNKAYDSAKNFLVRLIASSNKNCKDSAFKPVVNYAQPFAKFNINDSAQCFRSHLFSFTNNSIIGKGAMNYNWTFGDDSSSTSNNPTKAYNSFGNYTVKLKVTSDQNCTDSTSKNVSVFEMPVARFSVNDSDQCVKNNLFSFLNNSSISSGTNSYAWNFGDNSTSNITSPNKAYDSAKNFLVRLIASSNKNCKDSAFKPVVNYAQPFAKFNINDSAQCFRSHLFSFTNNSIIGKGAMNYNWTFGDDSSSTSNNPTKAYNSFGNYTVKLKVTSDQNCTDSTSKNVSVFEMPVARFSVNDSDQCVKNNLFSFLNNSSISSGTNSYAWNFGDNSTSNITSPNKAYDSAKNFLVRLIASSNKNCKDSAFKPVVNYAQPFTKFNINDSAQCFRSHLFSFTNNSIIGKGAMNYNWTFGDDSSSTSNNPTKAYNSFGNYTVKLKVTSDQNCTDSTSKNVSVFEMPVARFSVNDSDQCVKNNLFSFLNNSSISSGTNSYAWNFGDNSTSNITSPNKAYDSAKNFLVRLIASSNKNCKDSAFKPVVNYAQPFAKFNINDSTQCFRSHLFSFTNNSSDFDSIVYNWEFGNGDKIKTKDPNYQYNSIGFFTTKLSIVTKYGCMDSMFKNLEVCPMPISDFTMNDNNSCLKGNQFSFKNESLISDSSTLIYKWDLGDGTQSNWINLSHQYKTFGDYVINIIATSNNGCKDTVNKNISVYEHPKINFTINNKQACLLNNKFILKDITKHTCNIKNWDWIFYKANSGKDSIFNTSSMELKFNKIGKYNYQLIITDSNSCQDTIRESINVFPQSSLNFNTDSVCNGNKNTFISNNNIDTGFITELKWHFGDGLNDNKPNTTHAYKVAGRYNIMLTSTNSFGCKDTLIKYKSAQSREIPTTSFTYEKKLDSLTYTGYQFKSNSIGISNLDHFWTYNTNETSTLKNPYILFADSGMKSVKLEVKDEFGCKDETEKWIKAMPEIVVYIPNAFTPNEDGINDFFKPFGIVYNKEYEWIIINRWGELIFKSNNQMQGWNGKIKDKLVPEGVYAYLLKVTTAQNKQLKFAGTFHLIY